MDEDTMFFDTALLFLGEKIPGGVKMGWKHFFLFGLIEGCGKLFYASALQLGEVFRVLALIQTSPLFVVLLALLLLRKAENITWCAPVGAVMSVAGAILVNLRSEGTL